MQSGESVFDIQARAGLTKHMGGLRSTEALVQQCHIGVGSRVLDVGCGVGMTPCYLAEKHGCLVVGVDIMPAMVARARERVIRRGLSDRVEIREADAQDLPFGDASFDAVITESVTAFPPDKAKAVSEYLRVLKPGGYVGLTEATWLKPSPPPELVEWATRDLSEQASPLTEQGWVNLLQGAGLEAVAAEVHVLDARSAGRDFLRRYGWGELFRIWGRMVRMIVSDPSYRAFLKEVKRSGGAIPPRAFEFFGYGNYVGRKPGGA